MTRIVIAALALLAAGCSNREKAAQSLAAFDVAESAPERASSEAAPQIAYAYTITYRLDGSAVARVQSAQADACRHLGANRCMVMESGTSSADHGIASGSTTLLIDARLASAFLQRLDGIATGADGEVVDRRTTAEDLTRQLIDTDARVRAKQALAQRLLALIGNGNGRVGDLVEAEKAYAANQEELEAAVAAQRVLRQRVAMSRVDLSYVATETVGSLSPIRAALAGAGQTLAGSIATLVTAVVALAPWALLLALFLWVARRRGWRGPIRRWRDWRASRTG